MLVAPLLVAPLLVVIVWDRQTTILQQCSTEEQKRLNTEPEDTPEDIQGDIHPILYLGDRLGPTAHLKGWQPPMTNYCPRMEAWSKFNLGKFYEILIYPTLCFSVLYLDFRFYPIPPDLFDYMEKERFAISFRPE